MGIQKKPDVPQVTPKNILYHMRVPPPPSKGDPRKSKIDPWFEIGIFERRVTLYSQQARALNLIYSLFLEGVIEEGMSIVVIGGGAAGLTAAAAATRKGVTATVLEKTGDAVYSQTGNHTRYVHPHIYDWPYASERGTDAGLPVLNWTAGVANEVAKKLRQEWEAHVTSSSSQLFNNVDIDVGGIQVENGRTSIPFRTNRSDYCEGDAIIFAVGFGREKSPSYWDNDDLNQLTRPAGESEIKVLVSGIGDGGLTDVLRVALRGFDHAEFLTNAVALLDGAELGPELIEIERRCGNDYRRMAKEFQRVVVPLAFEKLFSSEKGGSRKAEVHVTLNSPDGNLFDDGASLLNRFLVARLFNHPGAFVCSGRLTSSVENPKGWYDVLFSTGSSGIFHRVVCRHGPHPAITSFPDVEFRCKSNEALRALDQTRHPIYPNDFFEPGSTPSFLLSDGSSPEKLAVMVLDVDDGSSVTTLSKSLQDTLGTSNPIHVVKTEADQ